MSDHLKNLQRLSGVQRGTLEISFALEVRGCPRCGSRAFDKIGTDFYDTQAFSPGKWQSAAHYDLTCPKCGFERRVQFRDGAPDQSELGLHDRSHEYYQHLGGREPSTIIEPHEFAVELAHCFEHAICDPALIAHPDPIRLQDEAVWRSLDGRLLSHAEICTRELRKFIPAGQDEVPDRYFATDDARGVRAIHPEWFRRDYIDAQEAMWDRFGAAVKAEANRPDKVHDPAESAALEAKLARELAAWRARAGLTRSTTSGPFTAGALQAHAQWLASQGGERLHATGLDATGAKLSALDLRGAELEDVTLDGADVSFTLLHAAKLTNVRARGAGFASAMVAGTTITRCDFHGAGMSIAKLGDATIEDCDFSEANLERTTWYRSAVSRCNFAGAAMTDIGIDKAVFTDCDFRGVDFRTVMDLLGSSMDAQFVRCDLRDTAWQGRSLFRVSLVDCKLAGAHGRPQLEETVVERADLSPAGDGSVIGGLREVMPLWGIDPDAPKPPPPAPTYRVLVYDLPDDEGDHLEDYLRAGGHWCDKRLYHRGTDLRFEVKTRERIAAPIAPAIDAELATFREAKARRAARSGSAGPDRVPSDNGRPPAGPPDRGEAIPDGQPPAELPAPVIAEAVIERGLERGESFEQIIDTLVNTGFSRENALEAMIDPARARWP